MRVIKSLKTIFRVTLKSNVYRLTQLSRKVREFMNTTMTTATTNNTTIIKGFIDTMIEHVKNACDSFKFKENYHIELVWTPSKTRLTAVLKNGDIRKFNAFEVNPRVRFNEIRYASRKELTCLTDATKEFHADYNFKYQTYERTLDSIETDLSLVIPFLLAEYIDTSSTAKKDVKKDDKTAVKGKKKTASKKASKKEA